jgi:hypothetical protein
VDYEVVVFFRWIAGTGLAGFKWAVGNSKVVGLDMVFSVEFQCRDKENSFRFINVTTCAS